MDDGKSCNPPLGPINFLPPKKVQSKLCSSVVYSIIMPKYVYALLHTVKITLISVKANMCTNLVYRQPNKIIAQLTFPKAK